MRSPFAALRTLVLPFGATTGPRIVLDGVGGQILVFDLAGQLYGSITPGGGFQVFDTFLGQLRTISLFILGGPRLTFSDGDPDEDVPGQVSLGVVGAGGTRVQQLGLTSGSLDTMGAGRLQLVSASADGTLSRSVRADVGNGFRGVSLSVVDEQTETTNDAAVAAGNATDMALTNVNEVAGRRYKVHFSAEVLCAAAAGSYLLRLNRNGTGVKLLARLGPSERRVVDASWSFTATATGFTDDFEVINDAGSAGTIQLLASATNERQLQIEDLGEA